MKTRIWKRVFLYSFLIYMLSTFYTRFVEFEYLRFSILKIINGLPLDFTTLESNSNVSTQIGVLSSLEIAQMLKTNADSFPNCYEGTKHSFSYNPLSEDKYVVIRFKNRFDTCYGTIKCYFSSLTFPISSFVFIPWRTPTYYNIIFPYPANIEKHSENSETIYLRWKNSWGPP
ncbi:MAG: hypothetical protein HKM07_07335 [Chlamydiae bacterium]|nr:hypothetical protein [Chlamydiota bacterium]